MADGGHAMRAAPVGTGSHLPERENAGQQALGRRRLPSSDGEPLIGREPSSPAARTGERLLLAIGDEDEAQDLTAFLRDYGFAVVNAGDVASAAAKLSDGQIDLAVLDAALPGGSALRLCQMLSMSAGPPIIILGAGADQPEDCIVALETGAAHYASRERGWRELLARIRSSLQQRATAEASIASVGGRQAAGEAGVWRYHRLLQDLRAPDGQRAGLSPAEAKIIEALIRKPRRTVSPDDLACAIGSSVDPEVSRSIAKHVSRIRRKILRISPTSQIIRTRHGRGYDLGVPVAELP